MKIVFKDAQHHMFVLVTLSMLYSVPWLPKFQKHSQWSTHFCDREVNGRNLVDVLHSLRAAITTTWVRIQSMTSNNSLEILLIWVALSAKVAAGRYSPIYAKLHRFLQILLSGESALSTNQQGKLVSAALTDNQPTCWVSWCYVDVTGNYDPVCAKLHALLHPLEADWVKRFNRFLFLQLKDLFPAICDKKFVASLTYTYHHHDFIVFNQCSFFIYIHNLALFYHYFTLFIFLINFTLFHQCYYHWYYCKTDEFKYLRCSSFYARKFFLFIFFRYSGLILKWGLSLNVTYLIK